MVEPSRSDAVKYLSNFVETASLFAGRRGELALPRRPFAKILPALLDQSSLKIAQILSTNLPERAEFHSWIGLAHRRDRDVGPCRAHHEEPIKAHCPAGTGSRSNTEFPPVLQCTSS
jgi:hypothetical protein